MWTVVYMSKYKVRIDNIRTVLDTNKIITMVQFAGEDDFESGTMYEILVPSPELEQAQDIIFDFESQDK